MLVSSVDLQAGMWRTGCIPPPSWQVEAWQRHGHASGVSLCFHWQIMAMRFNCTCQLAGWGTAKVGPGAGAMPVCCMHFVIPDNSLAFRSDGTCQLAGWGTAKVGPGAGAMPVLGFENTPSLA